LIEAIVNNIKSCVISSEKRTFQKSCFEEYDRKYNVKSTPFLLALELQSAHAAQIRRSC